MAGALAVAIAQEPQVPDKVLGTVGGEYVLFDPNDVVRAGSNNTAPLYSFFEQVDLDTPTITTPVTIGTTGAGYTWTLMPSTLFDEGLHVGPFHTVYEGVIEFALSGGATMNLELSVVHTFPNGQTLTSKRTATARRADGRLALAAFSSITNLETGTITDDDGAPLVITEALLAGPVTIQVDAGMTVTRSGGQRIEANLTSLGHTGGRVTFFQFQLPIVEVRATGDLPAPPTTGDRLLSASEGVTAWQEYPAAILAGLPARTSAAGMVLGVRQDLSIAWGIVRDVPDPTGGSAGNVLTIASNGTAFGWEAPTGGGGNLPTPPSGATINFLQGTAGKAKWVQGEIAPHFTSTNKDDCFRVNQLGTGVSWRDCPSGGGSGAALSDATPKADVPLGAAGSGTKASRDDHQHDLDGILAITEPLALAAAPKVGSLSRVAVADHVHPTTGLAVVSDDTPQAVAGAGAPGSAADASRSDHAHPITGLATAAALAAVRQVPDPAHHNEGDVLTIGKSSAVNWAAPSGGGTGGGAGQTDELLGTNSAALSNDVDNVTFSVTDLDTKVKGADWLYVRPIDFSDGNGGFFGPVLIDGGNLPAPGEGTGTHSQSWNDPRSYTVLFDWTNDTVKVTWPTTMKFDDLYTGLQLRRVRVEGGGGGGGSATPLSDGKPLIDGVAASGVGTAASRGDHVHPRNVSDAKPNALAAAADAGEATAASRADHVHPSAGINQVPAHRNVPSSLGYDVNYVLGFSRCISSSPGSNNENCDLSYQKPPRWQRHLIGTSAPTDFSGTGSFTIPESTYALQAFMQNTLTAYQKFELFLKFTHGGQEFHYLIDLAGQPPGEAQATETATYYSVNSNNSLTGNTQWARLQVGATNHTVTYHLNSQGESKVEARIYGWR